MSFLTPIQHYQSKVSQATTHDLLYKIREIPFKTTATRERLVKQWKTKKNSITRSSNTRRKMVNGGGRRSKKRRK